MLLEKYTQFFRKKKLKFHNGDFRVEKHMIINNELDKNFIPDVVSGDFDCSNLPLTSLKNSPEEVYGNFICLNTNVNSLEHISKVNGKVLSIHSVENKFVEQSDEIKDYYNELINYMIDNNIKLDKVKSWPMQVTESLYIQYQKNKQLLYELNQFGSFNIYKENWNIYNNEDEKVGKHYLYIDHNNVLIIAHINLDNEKDNKKMMKQIFDFCDNYKLYCALSTSDISDYKHKNKVNKFYKELGFVKNTLPFISEEFYRKPK